MNAPDKEDTVILEILQNIEEDGAMTQRGLSNKLGVALGLTNSYLKRCIRKGLVKIKQAPSNRYFYYLTPRGFTEKSRLTAKYLSRSLEFYRKAGDSINGLYKVCSKNRWDSALLCGVSDLAEIAVIRSYGFNIEIAGIYDDTAETDNFLGLKVWRDFTKIPSVPVCLLTELTNPIEFYKRNRHFLEQRNLLVPDILGLDRNILASSDHSKKHTLLRVT